MGSEGSRSENLEDLRLILAEVMELAKRHQVVPQAAPDNESGDSNDMSSPGTSEVKQNVDFSDAHSGYEDMRAQTASDPLRASSDNNDAPLGEFLSRPIRLLNIEWPVGTGVTQDINLNPWSLFFGNKRIINRLANFKLLRAKLKVKFLINGNGFYYGRMMASYQPLHNLDKTTIIRSGIAADLVEASQRPHIYLNPTESQGGLLDLPFFTPNNMIDIPTQEWANMGRITLSTLQSLKHANGGTDPISISIFAWAEDVHLTGLTQTNPADIAPQAAEYKGIISKPASTVAKVAGALSSIPQISGFATATEIGARSIAKMAALFGYSKPTKPDTSPFQPVTRQSMADTDGAENILKLTVDSKNELSIDPTIAGIDANDELTINSIASRESFLTSFNWNIGTAPEARLFNMVVDPAIARGYNDEIHMPACAFASMPFQYWRGTLKYRFQIVASGFHKGRLKFVYDPVSTNLSGSAEYNTAYTKIVDIADCNDFCIEVGWGQDTPWREHLPLEGLTNAYSTDALGYISSTVPYGNGVLSVYVVNELTSPAADTVNNDIGINVFVSACDNFEVAAPTDYYLSRFGFKPASVPAARAEVLPQALEIDSVQVTDPPCISTMGAEISSDSLVNKIHMGEAIASFRTLLKRYNLHEVFILNGNLAQETSLFRFLRPQFPMTPGYNTAANSSNSNVIEELDTGNYVYARMTLLNYLVSAYGAWRGSTRYTTDTTYMAVKNGNESAITHSTWSVSRVPHGVSLDSTVPQDELIDLDEETSAEAKYFMLSSNRNSNGITGVTRWNSLVNPMQSYEIPYYSRFRFAPARAGTHFIAEDPYQSSLELLCTTTSSTAPRYVYQYVAAGEDFTLMFYLSPPILYLQDLAFPTPPAVPPSANRW